MSLVKKEQVYRFKNYDNLRGYKFASISPNGEYICTLTAGIIFLFGAKYSSINDITKSIIKIISPNPTTGMIKIDFNLTKTELVNTLISNYAGQTIQTINIGLKEAGVNSFDYNTTQLTSGLYFITIKTSTISETYKLIKE